MRFKTSEEVTPGMVDYALAQTHDAGLPYAAIPLPWLHDWQEWLSRLPARMKPKFRWHECCYDHGDDNEWRSDRLTEDSNGNLLICLLERGHDGDCGHVFTS